MAEIPAIPALSVVSDGCGREDIRFHPFEQPQFEDIFSFFAHMRGEEPIFWSSILKMWVVTRYEDVQNILKNQQAFASQNFFSAMGNYPPTVAQLLQRTISGSATDGLIAADPLQTRLRAALTRAFAAQQIARLELDIRWQTKALIAAFPRQGPLDIVAHFTRQLPFFVICRLIGVPDIDQKPVRHWYSEMAELVLSPLASEQQLGRAQSALALHQYMGDLLEQRRIVPQDDLATTLLRVLEEEKIHLNNDELAELLMLLFTAGFETTMRFLSASLMLLLTQQSYWDALQSTPHKLPQLIEEGLRLISPAWGMVRMTTRQVQLGDVNLPPHAPVYLAPLSAHHDERAFAHPELLDIKRTNASRHLAFGHGIHFCVGAPLARLEVRIALEELSCQMPTLRLLDQQEVMYTPDSIVRGMKHLLVERVLC